MSPFRRALAILCLALLPPSAANAAAPRKLLVIAPEAWHPALAKFAAFKRTQLPTEMRSLEGILRDTPGADDPEKLKRFLYDQWRNRHAGYALLVGDVDVMPVRFMVLDRVTPAACDYAFYPTDLYYGDLAKKDGSFGRVQLFHRRESGQPGVDTGLRGKSFHE